MIGYFRIIYRDDVHACRCKTDYTCSIFLQLWNWRFKYIVLCLCHQCLGFICFSAGGAVLVPGLYIVSIVRA